MATKKLTHDDYTVGWAAVLEVELNAARLLLDEEHEPLPSKDKDDNSYLLGRMGTHNVVITFPAAGTYGTNAAAQMVTNMLRSFRNIRFGLLVGVGGGAPGPDFNDLNRDIRLGDVVVSRPEGSNGGVLQYDMGKWVNEEFKIQSHLNKPPGLLMKATKLLSSDQGFGRGKMNEYIQGAITKASRLPRLTPFRSPGRNKDRLFRANCRHAGGEDCSGCNAGMVEQRPQRSSDEPEVHYGVIASSNAVMKSAQHRDELRDTWGVSCFEMEAAGLMDSFPCVVIRGICDYSDDHKNKIWQPYAAVTAAGYAKDLLRVIKAEEVQAIRPAVETTSSNVNGGETKAGSTSDASASAAINQLEGRVGIIEGQLTKGKERATDNSQDQNISPSTPPRPQTTPPRSQTTPRPVDSHPTWPPAGLQPMSRDEMKAKWWNSSRQRAYTFSAPNGTDIVVHKDKKLWMSYNHELYQLYYCRPDKSCGRRPLKQSEWRLDQNKLSRWGLNDDVLYIFICDAKNERSRYILQADDD